MDRPSSGRDHVGDHRHGRMGRKRRGNDRRCGKGAIDARQRKSCHVAKPRGLDLGPRRVMGAPVPSRDESRSAKSRFVVVVAVDEQARAAGRRP